MRAIGYAFLMGANLVAALAAPSAEPVDFDTQVIPVLTRHGCNAGSCHGAAIGRGGFKLSLLGSGARSDHDAIAYQLEGRRVNLVDPDKSLLLRKPSEQVGHEGGLVLSEDSSAYEQVRRWIDEGAQRLANRRLTNLTITPDQKTLGLGDSVSVRVTATFNTGKTVDVTPWTVFQAADPEAVSIGKAGRQFSVHRRGVHVVIGRFLDRVLPVRLTVPMHDTVAVATASQSAGNQIDPFVAEQLEKLNLPVSPPANDWMFIRRVTLDLTGRIPTAEEVRRFRQDESPHKRETLIRKLMDTDDSFADYWALKWANEFGIDSKQLQPEGAAAYQRWLAERLKIDAPMNETSRMMLTSTGDSYVNGAVNFLRSGASPGDLAEQTSRVFMGVRLQCANCHDHPLDHWTQDDYHGLAAIFARLERGRLVMVADRGEVTHPLTGQPAVPRIPSHRYLDDTSDSLGALADWLTAADNSYFARAIVNRLWRQLMGRGLVDPVDDLRVTNPATHPELLRWLAEDFVNHGFRIKHTIGRICNSSAYGRDSAAFAGNAMDSAFYSHALLKPLEAEVVADAITDITGIALRAGNDLLPRTVTLTNNRMEVPSLDILGRCDRENACAGGGDSSVSLARTLHLINGELINSRVNAPDGRLHQLLASNGDDGAVLDEIFLRTLTSPPVAQTEYWKQQLSTLRGASQEERAAFFEDLSWSLMTSTSFATNR